MENMYFRINKPQVVSEIFDNETVVINLYSGNYYSLNDSATDIWSLIEKGRSFNDIIQEFSSSYKTDKEYIKNSIQRFFEKIIQEDLVKQVTDISEEISISNATAINTKKTSQFLEPTLDKFDDMQELLVLDPVHEANDNGWPIRGKGD